MVRLGRDIFVTLWLALLGSRRPEATARRGAAAGWRRVCGPEAADGSTKAAHLFRFPLPLSDSHPPLVTNGTARALTHTTIN